jgi:hypothetical protein
MASKKWMVLPGGRIKRWKQSRHSCDWISRVPPHWYRNHLNRKERRRAQHALHRDAEANRFFVHPRVASWYW